MSDSHSTSVRYSIQKSDADVQFKYGKYCFVPDENGKYYKVYDETLVSELLNCGWDVIMTDDQRSFFTCPLELELEDHEIDAALDWADYIADF